MDCSKCHTYTLYMTEILNASSILFFFFRLFPFFFIVESNYFPFVTETSTSHPLETTVEPRHHLRPTKYLSE